MNANRTTSKRHPGRKAAKSRRIELRVSASTKIALERASAMSGRSISDIVLQGAETAARNILDETAAIRLNEENSLRVAELLINPPKPNAALSRAAKAYRNWKEGK